MEPGDVVLIPGDEPLVAVLREARKKKWVLLLSTGREQISAAGSLWRRVERLPEAVDSERALRRARSLQAELVQRASEVDVPELWELLVDEDEARYSGEELADLALGDAEPCSVAATVQALQQDRIYFRQKQTDFEPNSRKLVTRTRERLEREEQRRLERERAMRDLREAVRLGDHRAAGEHNELLALLEGLAVHGASYRRVAAASTLLEELNVRPGKEPHFKAFDLLVRLGRFDRDENLLLRRHEIARTFREGTLAEAQAALSARPWEDPEREDLTRLYTIAIDDAETTEVDDAVSLEPGPGDSWTLWIHIADPSSIIEMDSELAREAQRRAATLYLPNGKTTMLPPELAEGPLSLVEGEDRAAVSLEVVINEDGEVERFRFLLSRVRVDRRLTYDEADLRVGEAGPLGALLHNLTEAADAREALRRAQGALILNGAEFKVRVRDGEVTVKSLDRLSPTRSAVAETMILVGTCAAQLFVRNLIPASYRCQEQPEEDIVLPEGPLEPAEFFATVKKIRRAEISRIPGRHAGLGVDAYVQISSPIRRFGDLVLQRQLKTFLQTGEPHFDEEELLQALGQTEQTYATLVDIERSTNRYWTQRYLQNQKGREMIAVVLEQRQPGRYYVELEELGLKANLDAAHGLPAGTRLTVRVGSVDPLRDRVSLRFVNKAS